MSALKTLGDAIERALEECPVSDVLSILTGYLVGLTVELVRRQGEDTNKSITLSGGDQRDITIAPPQGAHNAQQRRKAQMTDSTTLAPTDEAIVAWAMSHQTDAIKVLRGSGFVRVARAVLAKFGTPAPLVQPVAAPVGAFPVASKSHGAWDGIEEVLAMPDGTDIYTASQVQSMLAAAPQPPAQAKDKDEAKAQRLTEKRWLEVGKAVERACIELPQWAEVVVSLEKDAGTVKWFDGDGNEYDSDTHGDCFSETINNAIDAAIATQQGTTP